MGNNEKFFLVGYITTIITGVPSTRRIPLGSWNNINSAYNEFEKLAKERGFTLPESSKVAFKAPQVTSTGAVVSEVIEMLTYNPFKRS